MRIAMVFLALLMGSAWSESEFEKQVVWEMKPEPLKKSSLLTSTRYTSAHFNIDFIAPSGWTITKYDSSSPGWMTLTVSKSGRSDVRVFAARSSSMDAASYYGGWMCHAFTKTTKNNSSSTSVGFVADTTYSSGASYSGVGLSYDAGVGINQAYSTGIYTNGVFFFTSSSSFSSYSTDYGSVFLSITNYTTAISKGPRMNREAADVPMFNVLGQPVKSGHRLNLIPVPAQRK